MTKDLTKIKTPYGLLSKKTRQALEDAKNDGAEIQVYRSAAWNRAIFGFSPELVYRVAPEPKPTKPSIDWSAIDKRFKWLAVDKNGYVGVYDTKPCFDDGEWSPVNGTAREVAALLSSYQPGTCKHEDSLVKRPEDV